MTQEYRPTDDEILEALQQREAPVPEVEDDGGEDIFSVTEEDVMGTAEGEDLSEMEGEPDDDLSDLSYVSNEDVMGAPPQEPQPRYRITPRIQRPTRPVRRYPPSPTLGGMR